MTDASTVTPAPQGLRRNYLSGYELVFQSLGTVGPSATPAILLPVLFATSGNGTWLVFAFAAFTIFLLATQMRIFGHRIASPGAVYAYVNDGLGPLAGVIAAWSIMIAYIFGISTIPPQLINLVFGLLHRFSDIPVTLPASLGIIAIAIALPWWLAQRDIKLSTRITCLIEIGTMMLIIGLIGYSFWQKGSVFDPAQLHLQDFTLSQFHLGLVFAFFCFGGFETASELGAEARRPLVMIPRALFIVVTIIGVFFIFSAYGITSAFEGRDPGLDKEETPLLTMAGFLNVGWVGTLISIGLCSTLLASSLGCLNAGARVLYAMANRGLFYSGARVTHAEHATPHLAIAIVSIVGTGSGVVLFLFGLSPSDILNYLGTLCSFGFLFAYLLVAIAAPVYLKKQGKLRPWNVALAILTIALLIVPIAGSLYPVPEYPSNLLPYIFLAMLLAGMGYFLYVKKTDPARLKLVEGELLGPGPAV
jgi:amino acid transporter